MRQTRSRRRGTDRIVKTKTSRFVRKEYGETVLKKYYWKPYFRSDTCFVATVSENSLAMVREYIRTL